MSSTIGNCWLKLMIIWVHSELSVNQLLILESMSRHWRLFTRSCLPFLRFLQLLRWPRVGVSHHGMNLFGERRPKCEGIYSYWCLPLLCLCFCLWIHVISLATGTMERTIFKRNGQKAKVECIQIPAGRLLVRSTVIEVSGNLQTSNVLMKWQFVCASTHRLNMIFIWSLNYIFM